MIAINLKNRTFPRNLSKYAAQHKINAFFAQKQLLNKNINL